MDRSLALALVLVACGPRVAGGDAGGESDTSHSGSADASSTGSGTTTSTGTTVVGEVAGSVSDEVGGTYPDWGTIGQTCNPTKQFACGTGIPCDDGACGDPFSPFDANGCLRPSCPCVDGEVCFTPLDFGGCVSSGISCQERAGVCQCAMDPDCGGSYCLPTDEVPALPCLDFATPDECDAASCRWLLGADVGQDETGCVCFFPGGFCVPPLRYAEESPGAIYYRLDDPTRASELDPAPSPTPMGLGRCGVDEEVDVCSCAGACE